MNPRVDHPPILHPVVLAVPLADQRLTGRDKVAALRLHARRAAVLSARHAGLPLGILEKDADGVPLPSNGIYWSLSHKSAFVAAAVSSGPVGIDLEKIKPVGRGLYERLAGDAEWALASTRDPAIFFRYWTAKEAVLKAVGKGLAGLSRCRVACIIDAHHLRLDYENTSWTVVHRHVPPDHLVTLTCDPVRIVWHIEEAL
jgi:4'-phosphopantetheinyl transferase